MKTRKFFERWIRHFHQWQSRAIRRWQRRQWRHAVAISAATCISLSTRSQAEEAVAPPPPAAMPEVVVTGQQNTYKPEGASSPKYTQPLVDIPQTVTVIPQRAITEQGATTLREVLRNVPGISIQAGEGGVPAGDNLSVRGFNARTDIFIDGVRDFGGYSRDSFNIDQVEVSKGPSSSFAGRGSTGGAINMVSKYAASNPFVTGTLGLGTDSMQRATLDVNQKVAGRDDTAVRVAAMWHSQDVSNRDAVEADRWGVAPSIAFGLNGPTRVDLGFFHLSQDNVPDYGIPWVTATHNTLAGYRNQPPPVDYDNFYGLRGRDYERTKTDIGTAIVKHDVNEKVTLRSILRAGQTDRDSVITAPRFVSDNTTAINRNIQSRDQVDTILANQTDLTVKFNTGGIEHSVVTGVDLNRETSVNFARNGPNATTADLYNPEPNDPYSGHIGRSGSKTEAKAKSQSFYAFDTLKVGEKIELSGGARWDSFGVDFSSVSTTNVVTPLSRTDEAISFRAGAVFKPTAAGSVYAAYGTSFNPSAEGLTLANTATATNGVNTEPEKSRTVEVGTKWELLAKRLLANLAFFRTEKTNARTEDPASSTDIVVLEGRQRVDGMEVGAAGNLTNEWSLFSGYTYLDGKVISSKNASEVGRELANSPRHSFSVWSTYELPWNVDIGAGTQYVDRRFNSTTTPRKAPSYWLADAMAAYRVNQNVTLRLNAYNLFDKEYIDRVGGGHFIPGAGRSAVVTTEVKF